MEKVDRPKGLIRYDSHNAIAEKKKRRFTPRMAAYTGVLLACIGLEVFLLNYRVSIEALILRTPGKLYQVVDDKHLSNLYNYELVNKTNNTYENISFRLLEVKGEIQLIGTVPGLDKGGQASGSFFIILDNSEVKGHKNPIRVEIIVDGVVVDKVKTNFLGPIR